MNDLKDKARGSFLGLAVGDALGTTLEFKTPNTFNPITDMVGGGPFRLNAGEWTDDTSMALCVAASLIELEKFDLLDHLKRFIRWYYEGYMSHNGKCFDIGNTVSAALQNFKKTGNKYSGSLSPNSAGNGSIMRLTPVVLFYSYNAIEAMEMAGESSKSTHATLECVDACRFMAGIIFGALHGVGKQELTEELYAPIRNYWKHNKLAPNIEKIALGSYKKLSPPEIAGTGYVVDSLEAALWAFHNSNTFSEGALMAANLGEDADTTAAVYGQIAGAFYGEKGIKKHWLDKLVWAEMIGNFAEKLILKK